MTAPAREAALFDALTWQLAKSLSGARNGSHRGRLRDAGGAFADIAPLMSHPDPRRLDLRRSVTDPFGGFHVRRFERHTDITLHLLLDASASLTARASSDRQGLAALLCAGLAQAARRGGDRAALSAYGGEWLLLEAPPNRLSGAAEGFRQSVSSLSPQGQGVDALCHGLASLPHTKVLAVVISDFDLAPSELRRLLDCAGERPLLPIWLRDTGLEHPPSRFGLVTLRDPETRRLRSSFATRNWAAEQASRGQSNRRALRQVFQSFGLRPIEIRDSIDIHQLIEAFAEARL